eukprot:9061038-Pyramimonas_sp.AAC.1
MFCRRWRVLSSSGSAPAGFPGIPGIPGIGTGIGTGACGRDAVFFFGDACESPAPSCGPRV